MSVFELCWCVGMSVGVSVGMSVGMSVGVSVGVRHRGRVSCTTSSMVVHLSHSKSHRLTK